MAMRVRSGTLRILIDSLEISERQVARSAGLSHSTVNHLVTGRRTSCSMKTAAAIAKAIDRPVTEVFYEV